MAASDDKIRLGFDLNDALRGEAELRRIFEKINKGVQILEEGNVRLTNKGQLTSKQYVVLAQDGKKYVETLTQMTDAVVKFNSANKLYDTKTGRIVSVEKTFGVTARTLMGDTPQDTMHEQALRMDAAFENKRLAQREMALRMNENFDRKRQVKIGAAIAAEESLHEQALRMDASRTRRMEEQAAYRLARLQKIQGAALAENSRFDRKQYLNDWSAAIQEDKDRNPKTYFDKLLNQASAIASGIVISQVFMHISREIMNAIGNAEKFQVKISEIRTLSVENQQTTKEWADELKNLSDRFGNNIFDVAEGVYETLSNQIAKGADTSMFMAEAMKFAAVTTMNVKDSVDLLSSGITAYGKNANDTTGVAATFFKMIDLGRIRGSELANSIGTVTALTSQLGIPLNDVGATLSIMTRNGVTAANAMTYMRNVTTSLLKPSKEMKELFKEWGISSGTAAIQTYGLVGVMENLHKAVERDGFEELAKVTPNVRGLLGTSLLAGDNIEKFKHEIAQFQDSISGYTDKIGIAFESPGKKLQIFWNQLSNFFMTDFGSKFVDVAGTIAGWVGNIGDKLNFLSKVLFTGAAAWALYKIAMISWADIAAVSASLATKLTYVMSALNAAVMINPWFLLAVAIAAVVAAVYIWGDTYEEEHNKVVQKAKETAENLIHYDLEWLNKREEKMKQSLEKQGQTINQAVAKMRAAFSEGIDKSKDKLKDFEEACKETADIFKESFNEAVKSIQEGLSKLKSIIKEAESHINSFAKSRNTKAFEHSLDDLTPMNRIKAEMNRAAELRQQGNELKNEAFGLLSKGDAEGADEKIKQARTTFDEALQLIDNATKNRRDMNKGKLPEGLDPISKQNTLAQINLHDKVRVDMLSHEMKLKEDMEALDQHSLQIAIQKEKLQEDELSKTKKYRVMMFDTLKEVEGFKVTDKDTPTSIKEKIGRITAAQGRIDVSGKDFNVADATKVNADLEKKKQLLQDIFDKQQALNDLAKKERENDEAKKDRDEKMTKTFDRMKEDMKKIDSVLAILDQYFQGNAGGDMLKDALKPDAAIGAKEKGIKNIKDFMDSKYATTFRDDIRDEINNQIKTGEFYFDDFEKKNREILDLKKQMPDRPGIDNQGANNTKPVTYGDINVNITTQPGQNVDVRELAIEIRRQVQRGTVPAFA